MKRTFCIIFALIICVLLFAGCGKSPAPSSEAPEQPALSKSDGAATRDPAEDPVGTETPEPAKLIDMDAFLTDLTDSHPNASASELCDEILKNEYFILYRKYGTEFFYPGIKGEYDLKSKAKEAFCVIDDPTGSALMIIEPKSGVDPEMLATELKDNVNRDWAFLAEMYGEEILPDKTLIRAIGGKVFFTLYHGDMEPIGEYAKKARELVDLFHRYVKKHPGADALQLAKYFAGHQNFMILYAKNAAEGRLTGFRSSGNSVQITGFSGGAVFKPGVDPSEFIGYVFRVKSGTDVKEFEAMLKENADLNYNVCVTLNTVITATEGNYVLFMMCNE